MSAPPSRPPRRRLLRGGLWVALGFAVSGAASLVIAALLTRLLGLDAVGGYFLALSLVGALGLLAQAGVRVVVVRELSQALARGTPAWAGGVLRAALAIGAVGAGAIAVLAASPAGEGLLAWGFPNAGLAPWAWLLGLWVLAYVLRDIAAEACRGLHDIAWATLGQRVLVNLMIVAVLLGWWFTNRPVGLFDVLAVSALSAWLTAMLLWPRLHATWRAGRTGDGPAWGQLLRRSAPLGASQLLVLLVSQGPLWLLGALSVAAELAQFGVAARLSVLAGMALQIVNRAIMAAVAERYQHGDQMLTQRLLDRATSLAFLPSLLVAALLWLSADWLLPRFFGPEYVAAAGVLKVLLLSVLINVWAGSAAVFLSMSGHEGAVLRATLVSALVALSIAAWLVPHAGAPGAAWGVAMGMAVQNLLWVRACRELGYRTHFSLAGLRNAWGAGVTS